MSSERKPVVVHRPEPPREDAPPREARYTQEEMRALLAVTATTKPPWKRAARRGLVAMLPTLILSFVLDSLLGWWSIPVLVLLAVAWALRPLLRQSRDGWT